MVSGKDADRRQFTAWLQVTIVDLSLDAGHDLLGERLTAAVTDRE
jgi:hypothetical protein